MEFISRVACSERRARLTKSAESLGRVVRRAWQSRLIFFPNLHPPPNMSPTPRPVHELIANILNHPRRDFTTAEMAWLLGVDQWTITKAIKSGQIEASMHNYGGRGKVMRYRVEKTPFVAWVWKNTTGSKEAIRETIKSLAPAMLDFLERLPAAASDAAPTPLPEPKLTRPARAARAAAAPDARQPELF